MNQSRSNQIVYRFLGLSGLSMLGSRLTSIAIGIWLVKQTDSVTPLLLISLFNELPLLFFGVWIGWIVDRWKRRTAILVGDTGQVLCSLLMVISLMSGLSELWHLYAIITIQGFFVALQASATVAIMPLMVDETQLDRANSVKELLFPLASVIAPFIAGMLYSTLGVSGIVVIDFITFVFCSTAIALLPLQEIEDREQHKETDIWIEALQGYRYLWTNKPLLYLSIFMAWWNFILNGPLDLAIPYFLLRAGSISSMSILLGAMNAGALAGAIGAVWWGHFNLKLRFIVAGSLLTSSMFVLVGLSLPIWLLAASLFLLMLPLAVTGALFTSLLQQKTPFAMQGRVFTAFGQLSAATAPLSFLVTGPLVDQYLEPSMQAAKWELLNMLVGYDAGSGIGLLFVSCGFMLAGGVALMVASSKVRQIE